MNYYYYVKGQIYKGNKMPNDESMYYKRKSDKENWGDFLYKQWYEELSLCTTKPSVISSIYMKILDTTNVIINGEIINPIDITDFIIEDNGIITIIGDNIKTDLRQIYNKYNGSHHYLMLDAIEEYINNKIPNENLFTKDEMLLAIITTQVSNSINTTKDREEIINYIIEKRKSN